MAWRRKITYLLYGLTITFAMAGCETQNIEYVKVELHGLLDKEEASPGYPIFLGAGDSVTITDPQVIQNLSNFFPGLGSGRKAFKGIKSPKSLQLVFTRDSGDRITVYTRLYKYWGSDVDHGDLDIRGNFKSYLEALFTDLKMQKERSTRPEE